MNITQIRMALDSDCPKSCLNAVNAIDLINFNTFVGIYQPSPTAEYTEDTQPKKFDFLSELCHEWETVGKLPADLRVRHVIVRSGKLYRFLFLCSLLLLPLG